MKRSIALLAGMIVVAGVLATIVLYERSRSPDHDHVAQLIADASSSSSPASQPNDPQGPAGDLISSASQEIETKDLSTRRSELDPERSGWPVVRIIDEVGAPVRDSTVHLIAEVVPAPEPGGVDPATLLASISAEKQVSDANGLVRFSGGTLERFLLLATHSRLASAFRWVQRDFEAPERIELKLESPLFIRGMVVDVSRKTKVSNARLVAYEWTHPGEDETDPSGLMTRFLLGQGAVSGADGTFEMGPLRRRITHLFCHADGYSIVHMASSDLDRRGDIVVRLTSQGRTSGVVRNKKGEPVAGAKVFAASRGIQPPPREEVTTNEKGEFSFERIPAGPSVVGVFADGYGLGKLFFEEEGPPGLLEFILDPQASLGGVVVDDRGVPVVGAVVGVLDIDTNSYVGEMETEAEGKWYMNWIVPDHRHGIVTTKDGHTRTVWENVMSPKDDLTLVMPRLGSIAGTVRDEVGAPVSSFSVRNVYLTGNDDLEHKVRDSAQFRAFESAEGQFQRPGLWVGSYEISVQADGFEPLVIGPINVLPGDSTMVEVTLIGGTRVQGTILDSSNAPIVAAEVVIADRVSRGGWCFIGSALGGMTDVAGAFNLRGVFTRLPFGIAIRARGFGTRIFPDLVANDFPRTFHLERAGRIEGQVSVRWPAPESVYLIRATVAGTAQSKDVRPDPLGSFVIDDLSPGSYLVELIDEWLGVEKNTTCSSARWVEVSSGQTVWMELALDGTLGIEGKIACNDSRVNCNGLALRLYPAESDVSNRRALAYVEPDTAGHYSMFGVAPGDYTLELSAELPGLCCCQRVAVDVDESNSPVTVNFAIAGEVLKGRVQSMDEPIKRATVSLLSKSGGRLESATAVSPTGEYAILDSAPGRYLVYVSAPGFAEDYSQEVDLPPPAGSDELYHELEPEARLLLRVLDQGGRALSQAAVKVEPRGRPGLLSPLSGWSEPTGIEFTRLGSGPAFLFVFKEGYVPIPAQAIQLQPGSTKTLEVMLTQFGSVEVRITGAPPDSRAQRLVTLVASSSDSTVASKPFAETDAAGIARLERVPPGIYSVESDVAPPESITVRPGSRTFHEIVWRQ